MPCTASADAWIWQAAPIAGLGPRFGSVSFFGSSFCCVLRLREEGSELAWFGMQLAVVSTEGLNSDDRDPGFKDFGVEWVWQAHFCMKLTL